MQKKIPQRTCIACKNVLDKNKLLRISKSVEGFIHLDLSKKADGRGCYVCDNETCVEKLLTKKLLNRTYKMNIDSEVYDNIRKNYDLKKS